VRDQSGEYEGYSLWLKEGEPSWEQIIKEIGDPKAYEQIVFCGYGEPTYRVDDIVKISDYVHANGGRTRMNTNGHGNLINGRNIAPELAGKVDGVNISLNAPDEGSYNALCKPHIDGAFEGLIDFAKFCKNAGVDCWFSVVDCIGEEALAKCRKVAENAGIPLRVRAYIG
jgi:TatD family-associated radical SAM protein